jgi:hypothetical protein
VKRKQLTYKQIAQRTALCPRTIQRFLEGKTFSVDTLERIEVALRIRAASEGDAGSDSSLPIPANVGLPERDARKDGPVYGWDQAAQVLGISVRTLHRRRLEAGDETSVAWWKSGDAAADWFEALVSFGGPQSGRRSAHGSWAEGYSVSGSGCDPQRDVTPSKPK